MSFLPQLPSWLTQPITSGLSFIQHEIAPLTHIVIPSPTQLITYHPTVDLPAYYGNIQNVLRNLPSLPNIAATAQHLQNTILNLPIPSISPAVAARNLHPQLITQALQHPIVQQNLTPEQVEHLQYLNPIIPISPPGQPTGPSAPPPSAGACVEPVGSLNPADWLQYIACTIRHAIQGLGTSFPKLELPVAVTNWFTGWENFFVGVKQFFTESGAFYRQHAKAMWEEGSPGAIPSHMDSAQGQGKKDIAQALGRGGNSWDITKLIGDTINEGINPIQNQFDSSIDPDQAIVTAQKVSDEAVAITLGVAAGNLALEFLPTENFTGAAFLSGSIISAFNLPGYVNDYYNSRWQKNVLVPMNYLLNEKYSHALPNLDVLILERKLGLITNEVFTKNAIRTSQLNSEQVRLAYKSSLGVINFDDLVTYQLRHPEDEIDFGALQDLININYVDHKKFFDERRYADLSIRYVLNAAKFLNFDEPKIRRILALNRLDPRPDPVLGESMLDIATKVIMKQIALYNEDLSGMSTKSKHFGYALLIQMAEQGIDNRDILDDDLKAEGWNDTHRERLEAYIDAKVKAKAAKTASGKGTSGG